MRSRTWTVVEWKNRGKGSAVDHRKAGLGFVCVSNFFCFGGAFFVTAFKFMSHKHQTCFLLLLSSVHHRVSKVSVVSHLV